jgi:hypothetical protein
MNNSLFRVCRPDTEQGLWYNFDGSFSGLIHSELSFCSSNELKMPFDDELVGFLSATRTLDELYNWFSVSELKKLEEFGWFVYEYQAENFKFYEKFQHFVICQKTSKIIRKVS